MLASNRKLLICQLGKNGVLIAWGYRKGVCIYSDGGKGRGRKWVMMSKIIESKARYSR